MPRIHTSAIVLFIGGAPLLALGCQNNPPYPSEAPAQQSAAPGESPEMYGDDSSMAEEEQEMAEMPAPVGEEEQLEPPQLSEKGREFIDKAGHSRLAEVELSKVAVMASKTQNVRDFAQKMIDTHSKMNEELTTLAQQLGAQPPMELAEVDKERKDKLMGLKGRKLDNEYIDMMVDDHQKAVELFRDQAENDQDPQLQGFAAERIAILEEHLDHAKHIDEGKTYRAPQASATPRPSPTSPSRP
jgi:putative membrane protein